jgi:hypothetical protein
LEDENPSLYVFSFFSVLAGIASSTGYQPKAAAPNQWGIAVFLGLAGAFLQWRR